MKLGSILLTVLLSAAVSFGVVTYLKPGAQGAAKKETAFERVMRTNTLRCGYYAYPPITIKDPNTGKMSGFSVEMMDLLAEKTGLKIEWTEEITFGTWPAALQAGRFDAVCTPLWADASYVRVAAFTRPMFYSGVVPVVRMDETRFSGKRSDLNTDSLTITSQEGNLTEKLIKVHFPKAKVLTTPAGSDYALMLQNVVAKKADVALWDRAGYLAYTKNNPGQVKILELDQPIKLMPCELPVLKGDEKLRDLLDAGIEDLLLTGQMDQLLDKWEEPKGAYLRLAQPYAPAKN